MDYDVIIVGGAPAGLTAAMYAARRRMSTLVVSADIGGQAAATGSIENYPGFLKVSGVSLTQKFYRQAVKAGAEVILDEVVGIEKTGDMFLVKTSDKGFKCRAVILAFGKIAKRLGVNGEKELERRGISYCASCDMPLYKNKTIAVVGGGNSALDAAVYGSKVASKVYLIHRRDNFRAFESAMEEAKKRPNIEFLLNTVVKEIRGTGKVTSIIVEDVGTKETREMALNGIFVEIGSEVNTGFVRHLVRLDEYGQIVVNSDCEAFQPEGGKIAPGIFAAGDVTNTSFKQIVVAAGEGCKAALQAYNYLHGFKPVVSSDWAKKVL